MAEHKAPPPAPAYTAVPMAPLAQPLQVAVIDGDRWVCMRSLIEGLGIAWLRWANAFVVPAPVIKPLAALDHARRPTWLLRHNEASNWWISCAPHLRAQANAATRRRLAELSLCWHPTLYGPGTERKPGPGRRRSVTAQTIEALYAAVQQAGNIEAAAAKLGLNLRTARKLQIYSFPGSTPDMLAAWQRTFGRL